MKKAVKFIKCLILLVFLLIFSLNSFAQEGGGGNGADVVKDSITDITIVTATGLMGAILGVSTLPFVEEPSEHLNSILIGGSIGIILGVGFVAYKQAIKGRSFQEAHVSPKQFGTKDRYAWHRRSHQTSTKYLSPGDRDISSVTYSFRF